MIMINYQCITILFSCRPGSSREYNRDKTLDERGGRLDGMNTARARIERSLSPRESPKERAKLVFEVVNTL